MTATPFMRTRPVNCHEVGLTPRGSPIGRFRGVWRVLALMLVLVLVQAPCWGDASVTGAQSASVPPPPISARAALVVDDAAGVELYALNPDERLPPASLTKIATALVVIQFAELDEQITIDQTDLVDITVFSHMGVLEGDVLTVEQLLYGLLLPSGNDAAHALARHIGGSLLGEDGADATPETAVQRFVTAMNTLATDLGLTNTAFKNVAGEDEDGHFSSARDLAILTGALLDQDVLAAIVQVPSMEITSVGPLATVYPLYNSNLLLADEQIIGVKTGTTESALACLIAARQVGPRNRVISVVLGSGISFDAEGIVVPETDRRYDDTRAILAGLDADYQWLAPTDPASEAFAGLADELAAWQVGLKPGPDLPVPAASLPELSYQLVLGPAGEPDGEVGRVLFFIGSASFAALPVYQLAADAAIATIPPETGGGSASGQEPRIKTRLAA